MLSNVMHEFISDYSASMGSWKSEPLMWQSDSGNDLVCSFGVSSQAPSARKPLAHLGSKPGRCPLQWPSPQNCPQCKQPSHREVARGVGRPPRSPAGAAVARPVQRPHLPSPLSPGETVPLEKRPRARKPFHPRNEPFPVFSRAEGELRPVTAAMTQSLQSNAEVRIKMHPLRRKTKCF